mgnify:CR=1 FL=1
MHIHHDKHHAKYVTNTKDLLAKTPISDENDIVKIVRYAAANQATGLFNNAAQCYNHAFYWECMRPNGGG